MEYLEHFFEHWSNWLEDTEMLLSSTWVRKSRSVLMHSLNPVPPVCSLSYVKCCSCRSSSRWAVSVTKLPSLSHALRLIFQKLISQNIHNPYLSDFVFLCATWYLYSYSPDFTMFVLKTDRKNASLKLFLVNFSFRNGALYVYLLTICDWLFYSLLKKGLKCWIMDLDFLMSLNWKLVTIQRNQAPNWSISTRSGHIPCGKKAAHS